MSMKTEIIYGYGVYQTDLLKVDINKVEPFIKKYLPEVYEEMMNDCGNIENTADYVDALSKWIDNYEGNSSCEKGLYVLIADVISADSGLSINYFSSEYDSAIIMPEGMPWNFNLSEINLTQDSLKLLFEKYFSELMGPDDSITPDYQRVESFG